MKKLYSFIENKPLNLFIIALILLNILAMIIETEPAAASYEKYLKLFENISIILFSIEYVLRLITCTERPEFKAAIRGRLKYASTPLAVIDLLAILPFYLPMLIPVDLRFLRIIRIFRIFRIMKLTRYSKAFQSLGRVIKSKKEELLIVLSTLLIFLVIISCLMYYVEHEAQPKAFSSILSTMWWSIVTLTTVGYGDIFPITPLGKILAAFVALCGIGMFAIPAGILSSGFTEEIQRLKKEQEDSEE